MLGNFSGFIDDFSHRRFCLFLDSFSRTMESSESSFSSNLNLFSSFLFVKNYFHSFIGTLFTLLRRGGQSYEENFSGLTKEWFTTTCDGGVGAVGILFGDVKSVKKLQTLQQLVRKRSFGTLPYLKNTTFLFTIVCCIANCSVVNFCENTSSSYINEV